MASCLFLSLNSYAENDLHFLIHVEELLPDGSLAPMVGVKVGFDVYTASPRHPHLFPDYEKTTSYGNAYVDSEDFPKYIKRERLCVKLEHFYSCLNKPEMAFAQTSGPLPMYTRTIWRSHASGAPYTCQAQCLKPQSFEIICARTLVVR
jgi:hypothetical protein